jgi:hypothetical protein
VGETSISGVATTATCTTSGGGSISLASDGAVTSTTTTPPPTCTPGVTSSLPTGTYTPGSPVSASVTVDCYGSGSWQIIPCSNPTNFATCEATETGPAAASGSFSVSSPASLPATVSLFTFTAESPPLPRGGYLVTVTYLGVSNYSAMTVSTLAVTNELPLGALAATGVAFVGLVAARRLSRRFSRTAPLK